MAKVEVYGSAKTMAKNPWWGTRYGKKATYIRDAVPWDNRKGGYDALRPAQKQWIEYGFIPTAHESGRGGRIYQECLAEGVAEGTMQMNVCRITKMKQELKRKPEPKWPPEEMKPYLGRRGYVPAGRYAPVGRGMGMPVYGRGAGVGRPIRRF